MKLCLKILAIAVVAATTYSLTGCAGPSVANATANPAITMVATCADCPIGMIFAPTNNMGQPVPTPASNNAINTTGTYAINTTPIPPGAIMLMDNQGEGGTVSFSATINGAPATNMTWTLYPTPVSPAEPGPYPTGGSTPVGENSSPYGSIAVASGNSAYYTWNPAGSSFTPIGSIPYYTGTALAQANAMGIPQGTVDLVATAQNPDDPSNPSDTLSYSMLIQVYNQPSTNQPSAFLVPRTPSNPSGLTTSVATVPHNPNFPTVQHTFSFYGGTIGSEPCYTPAACSALNEPYLYTDNTSIWEIGTTNANGVVCSLAAGMTAAQCPEGWIDQAPAGTPGYPYTAIYTAPPTVPATQPCITVVSHVDTAVSAWAYITVD
jgi:hypothetical protein